MSAEANKLNIAELDFEAIKSNFKAYLARQSEFSDYNFEGSGMSVLLDILSYNTHYMGYYLNMIANEMFIDTALMRPSVVSHAKLLGYTPRSRIASEARVTLTITEVPGGANSQCVLPRFTRFASESKDTSNYIFLTNAQHIVEKDANNKFIFENLSIKEGTPVSYSFTYDPLTNPKQIFELPNAGIDTSTLQVQVQASAENSTIEPFYIAESFTTTTSDSPVFFLEENRNGQFQIYFGDGIIGKELTQGNIVNVSYLLTNGTPANGVKTFKLLDNPMNGANAATTTLSEAMYGLLEETVDDIKFSAPKAFISRNRAVTKNDYISLITKNYAQFEAASVWGGDELDPPEYGKVFFSLKPKGNFEITATEIENIKREIVDPISILTVIPEYVQPDYIYLNLGIDAVYDNRLTLKSPSGIKTAITTATLNFVDQYLNKFNNTYKVSRLVRMIDDSDPSILNSCVRTTLEKRFQPLQGQTRSYSIDFGIPLKAGTAAEQIYFEPSFTTYDKNGVLRTAYLEEIPVHQSGIDRINVTARGRNYTSIPKVVITGDGTGAKAEALLLNGKVRGIKITQAGANYSTAHVSIVGGGGFGATAEAQLQGRVGKLQIYYFDSQKVKRVITRNAGTINYKKGLIRLVDFNPITVKDPFGTMVVKATPQTNIFSSSKNSILTVDTTDPKAIKVKTVMQSENE